MCGNMVKIYNKLVRDNIPEIIRRDNQVPIIKVLNDNEYKKALEDKIMEEYKEVIESLGSDRLEELADMLELIKALAEIEKSSLEEVIELANNKRDKRGGFSKRIFLERIEEK